MGARWWSSQFPTFHSLNPAIAGAHLATMGDSATGFGGWRFGTISNTLFEAIRSKMSSDTVMEAAPTTRADPKRRRSPVMELDEESPQAKRVRRSSPLSATNRMQTEPISNGRRAGSVKALVRDFLD